MEDRVRGGVLRLLARGADARGHPRVRVVPRVVGDMREPVPVPEEAAIRCDDVRAGRSDREVAHAAMAAHRANRDGDRSPAQGPRPDAPVQVACLVARALLEAGPDAVADGVGRAPPDALRHHPPRSFQAQGELRVELRRHVAVEHREHLGHAGDLHAEPAALGAASLGDVGGKWDAAHAVTPGTSAGGGSSRRTGRRRRASRAASPHRPTRRGRPSRPGSSHRRGRSAARARPSRASRGSGPPRIRRPR